MAFFWRIWTAVVCVNFAVLTLFVVLATLQFASINSNLLGERLVVLAGRIAAPFEAAARIGLPLSTVRNADALLARARLTDNTILSIHVFDSSGWIIHSNATATPARPVAAPAAIPPEAAAARAAAGGTPWYRETAEGFLSSVDIFGGNGAPAGGILIVYPRGGSFTRVLAMAAELAIAAIAVFIATAALSALLLRLCLVRQIALFTAIDNTIAAFERSAWRSAAGEQSTMDSDVDASGLRSLMEAAEIRYRTDGQMLATAEPRPT